MLSRIAGASVATFPSEDEFDCKHDANLGSFR